MRRRLALRAEVLAGADEAGAEVGLPDPVDDRAGRRRRLPVDQPAGEGQPVGGLVRRAAGSGTPARPASTALAGLEEVAALEQVRLARLVSRSCEHQLRRALGMLLPERLDPVVGLLPLGHGRPPVAEDGRRSGPAVRLSAGIARISRTRRGHRVGRGVRPVGHREAGSGRGCCSGCRRCSSRRAFWVSLNVRIVPAGNATGFSSTKTALRGTLRRPGPASMPQAVSSLPSMAKAIGPVTRRRAALVVEDRLERASRAG